MQANRPNEPSYGDIATFSKLPLVLDPAELAGVDVAILDAPFDETVSNRPGSRFGPRAIRAADDSHGVPPSRPHMWSGIDPFAELRVVDYGDAETVPGNPPRPAQVRRRVGEICAAGAVPIILGGDHSVAHPNMAAIAEHRGKGAVGVIHFDAHADTAALPLGRRPLTRHADAARGRRGLGRGDRFIQVGLRGWWPEAEEFRWMRKVGFRWYTMYQLDERGFDVCLSELIGTAQDWGSTCSSRSTRRARPGLRTGHGNARGRRPHDARAAPRRAPDHGRAAHRGDRGRRGPPAYDPSGITAVNAHRLVIETLSGLALGRSGRDPQPEHDGRPHV